jgi:murein DD-endopeptidase MepM/ murein hydrolase activator NlpD
VREALALALLAAGCGHLGSGPPLHPDNPPGVWYVVQPGESLADIAGRAGVPVEDVAELNGLRRGETLAAGKLIYVLYGDEAHRVPAVAPLPEAPTTAGADAPLRWPLDQPRLTSSFGARDGRPHDGIDMGAPIGTPIRAAADGRVLYAGDGVRGYGNMVVLEHAGDLLTVYAHSSVLLVRTGDRVAAGQEIARVGQSGRATAPHLHFEVRRGQVPQDPLRFLPGRKGSTQ